MLVDLAKNISDLAEEIGTLNEEIVDEATKGDLIYELENLVKNIELYLEEDD